MTERPEYWCPHCLETVSGQKAEDDHVISHVAAGEWPNAPVRAVLAALCRRAERG